MLRADRSLPDVALTRRSLDRHGELRSDPALLTRLLADPATRVFRLRRDAARRPRGRGRRGHAWSSGRPCPPTPTTSSCTSARRAGCTTSAWSRSSPEGEEPGEGLRTLRQVGARLDDLGASLFATTLALANWHRHHGFCPRCGRPTVPGAGRLGPAAARPTAASTTPAPTSRSSWPSSTPTTGCCSPGDAVSAAGGCRCSRASSSRGRPWPRPSRARSPRRSGSRSTDVTYLGDQPWPFPSSLMVGFTARTRTTDLRLQESEIAEARWFTRDELVAAIADGSLVVPGRVSIARRLRRALVRRAGGGPRRRRPALSGRQPSRVRTSATEGFVAAEPSGKRTVGHGLVAAVDHHHEVGGVGLALDVDLGELDALALHLRLEAAAVAAPRRREHRHGAGGRCLGAHATDNSGSGPILPARPGVGAAT